MSPSIIVALGVLLMYLSIGCEENIRENEREGKTFRFIRD